MRRARNEYAPTDPGVYSLVAMVTGCQVIIDSGKHTSLACALRRGAGLDPRRPPVSSDATPRPLHPHRNAS